MKIRITRRLLKITGVVLGVLAFVTYFAFSTFFFAPHEGGWKYDVSGLIPRQVDFYVSKANLDDSFGTFPQLAVAEDLEENRAWTTLRDSGDGAKIEAYQQVAETLAEIERVQADIPLGITLIDLFGGNDLAIAGEFEAGGMQNADWAVYGRVGWAGKLAVSMLDYPGLIGLEDQGLSVEDPGDAHWILSGGQLGRPLHVSRHRDVVVLTTSEFYVSEVARLANAGGADSVLMRGDYADHVQRGAEGHEIEIVVNLLEWFRTNPNAGEIPDSKSDRFVQAFAGRLIQASNCKNLLGRLGFDDGLQLDLHAEITTENVTDFQRKLYRSDSFDHQQVRRVASLAPDDTTLLLYMHGPVEDLLREALASAEPALRSNLEDAFRSTGRWRSLDELVEEIGDTVHDRLALIVRKNDYKPVEATVEGSTDRMSPENDGAPVFAFTLILWTKGEIAERNINGIRDTIGNAPDKFGLQGGVPDDDGYYIYELAGMDAREFWSPFVPGTGLIITLLDDENRLFISNHPDMLSDLIQGARRKLSNYPEFKNALDDGLPASNLLLWFKPENGRETMREMAQQAIDLDIRSGVDWVARRAREEREAMPQLFPGKRRNQLSEDEESYFNDQVDQRLTEWFDQFKRDQRPVLMAESERDLIYLNAISSMMVGLKLDPKSFDLSFDARIPLDE